MVVGFGVLRIECDGAIEVGDGSVHVALGVFGNAAVHVAHGVCRIEVDGAIEVGHGSVQIAFFSFLNATVIVIRRGILCGGLRCDPRHRAWPGGVV